MKIAFFTDTFLPQINGMATSIANFAYGLGKNGHKVLIFVPKVKGINRQEFRAKNVKIVHLPSMPAFIYPEFRLSFLGLPIVLREVSKFRPDVIHLQTPFLVGLDALLSAKIFKIPLVGTIHIYLTTPEHMSGWVINKRLVNKNISDALLKAAKFFFDACEVSTCPSKVLIKDLIKTGYKSNVEYLPNPVVKTKFPKLNESEIRKLKKKYNLKEKVILHFGRLSEEKKVEVVIEAFSEVLKEKSNVSLLIVGDGPKKEELEKKVKDLGLSKNVVFTGFIEHEKLISGGLINLSDVFVTACEMENNPMVVLEAMSAGLPIVGVRKAGLVELVKDNGYLVRAGDVKAMSQKIVEIVSNSDLSLKLGQKSLEYSDKFSVEKLTEELEGLYQKAIRLRRKRGRLSLYKRTKKLVDLVLK
ncbi:hypothetical protein A2716_01755 [candidate division WWE3 bacterium RIFCSPHIGHO2_01_FULL_40_23]|uniref:Glycosyltransferase subfamily 4-like N-terminal domain-containing protein n=1 Tax=candidate division WWE3 bacterium RIFCSPLOWO2_01_FULL_41_18 TaxID=1802625 RepID=A0A1F4VFL7_UNCKA|nr:MAG: hypothetical protein A2716_01755 [candidate division WWE3 bacterium RIFCSPHIGHO2_01_FULL_40_23]OGC55718.1 MAG: hypothetical protein A3A78_01605 [candidate division WWE3 bacterium RIFCSPLOWO2_01_FULL_41_18]